MGISKITLGPRSRVLQEQEAKLQEQLDDAGLTEADLDPEDQVAHPPTPGPANPTSLRGCGCGKWHITPEAPAGELVVDGVTHRYSKPCFQHHADGTRTYFDFKAHLSLEQRVEALEAKVAGLMQLAGAP